MWGMESPGAPSGMVGFQDTCLHLLMIPRVFPAQQCRAILLGAVHQLQQIFDVSFGRSMHISIEWSLTKNHMLAPRAVAVKR